MLDEPTDSNTPSTTENEAPAPKKTVRRRASKPAAAPDEAAAPSLPEPTPAQEADEAPAKAPAKRSRARKAPAKTAEELTTVAEAAAPAAPDAPAAPAPSEQSSDEGSETAAPAKRAPRKRAARKVAAPVEETPTLLDEPAADVEDDPAALTAAETAETTETAAEPAAEEPAPRARRGRAPAVVTFVAPDEVSPPARRGRSSRSARPAAAETSAPVAEATTELATEPTTEATTEPTSGRGRGRRRASSSAAPEATATVPTDVAVPFSPPVDEPVGDEGGAPRRRRRASSRVPAAPQEPTELDADETEDAVEPEDGAEVDADDEDRPRSRRRRGRRGRGRRPEGEDGAEDTEDEAPTGEEPVEGEESEDEDEDGEGASGTRRRRRRRRRGGSGAEGDETALPPVVHVREPREKRVRGASAADEDGVRGITGSTRMAAKRVRRQEGRDSGRRRTPVLSEAEFLARREAVERHMVVRQRGELTQIAVLEDGVLVEHYVTKESGTSYAGNVYLGKVQNVLPSMEAAFVDIGKGRNGVLYAGEVNYEGAGSRKIEQVLKGGQDVLVQVSKDPIGHKGARLTAQISLPGRYLVYVPEGSMTGISRKLPENERARLKSILKKVVPEDAGVIIRTAAEGASEEEIAADVRRLQAQWEVIQRKAASTDKADGGHAPKQLQSEPDLVVRVVRDVFNEDFASMTVSGDSAWDTISEYVQFVAPDLAPRLKRHTSERDVFAEHRIDEQLLKALDRKVHLPSGGSLVIDRTEAMVVVDVNTGKYVGKGGNLEETVTRNNLEAAEEIARQLRLRDLGGIIVVDFIDMVLESNRDLVVRRLVECLGRDRTKHQVAEVTSLGLVQMTRKRVGQGLLESFSEPCDACGGRGVHVRTDAAGSPAGPRGGGGGSSSGNGAGFERVAASLKPKPESAVAEVDASAEPAGAESPEEDAAPKRRRRGGRGRGSATVAPQDELSELLAEASPALSDPAVLEVADPVEGTVADLAADAPAVVAADPVAGSAPTGAPADGEPAEEPAAEEPAAEEPTVVAAPEPAGAEPVAAEPVAAEPAPSEEPAPKRRRRAARPAAAPQS